MGLGTPGLGTPGLGTLSLSFCPRLGLHLASYKPKPSISRKIMQKIRQKKTATTYEGKISDFLNLFLERDLPKGLGRVKKIINSHPRFYNTLLYHLEVTMQVS